MNNRGYQPAAQTTVVVVPSATRMRAPAFLQQGVKVGGMMLGLSCVACLGMFGIIFVFTGILMLSTANYDYDYDDFDDVRDPSVVFGVIVLVIGLIMSAASVGVCFYARKNYRKLNGMSQTGRVISNPDGYAIDPHLVANPQQSQPAGYLIQPQQAGYLVQTQPAGFPIQSTAYPGQPAGYPGQPVGYPGQLSAYPGQPAFYPGQPTSYKGQLQPQAYPESSTSCPGPPEANLSQSHGMPYEYMPPPPHVPSTMNTASAPPPYSP